MSVRFISNPLRFVGRSLDNLPVVVFSLFGSVCTAYLEVLVPIQWWSDNLCLVSQMLSSVLSGYHLESTTFTYLEGAIWQFRYSVFECRGRHLLLGGVSYLCKRQGNFRG